MGTGVRADKSIERRLQALERNFPPGKWDLRKVPIADLEALLLAFDPSCGSQDKPPKISKRLLRLITKLESDAQ
jgi:hypothetical protein